MAEPVRLIFPIGRSNGPFYEKPGADVDSYSIQYGWNTFDLDWDQFQVWTLAHGVLPDAQRVPWTRHELIQRATKAGVNDVPDIVDGLLEDEILKEVELHTTNAVDFAKRFRLIPQLFSLGNTSKTPWLYELGLPDKPLMQVAANYFLVWRIGSVSKHLWDSIEALVDAGIHTGQTDPATTDSIIALNGVLEGLNALIAAGCFYFDTVATDWRDQI